MGQCRISSTTPTQIQESHTGWDNIDSAYNGKFYVPDSRIGEMYALMAKAIFSDNEMITLAERPRVAGPLRIDFDIKYTIDEQAPPPANERVYGGEFFFDSVIASLTGAIAWHIKMPKETYKRLLYVFEKAEPTPINKGKTEWKDGFHIMMTSGLTDSYTPKQTHAAMIRSQGFPLVGEVSESIDGVEELENGVSGNSVHGKTVGVVQIADNPGSDGHFVIFSPATGGTSAGYDAANGFMESLLTGTPVISK